MNYQIIEINHDPEARGDYDDMLSAYNLAVVPSIRIAHEIIACGEVHGIFAKHAGFRYTPVKTPCTFHTAQTCLEYVMYGDYYGKVARIPLQSPIPDMYHRFDDDVLDKLMKAVRAEHNAA